MVDYGLKGRVALITGINNPQGIGAATAYAFAREGAKLVLAYKRIPREFDENKTDRDGPDRYDFEIIRPMLWKRNIQAIWLTTLLSGGSGTQFDPTLFRCFWNVDDRYHSIKARLRSEKQLPWQLTDNC